jgi:signal peptidase I
MMEASFQELRGTTPRAAVKAARGARTLAIGVFRALQWSFVILAAAVAVGMGVLPHLGLYRTLTVLSASMTPTFRPGDIVVVRPEPMRDLHVGQVITYQVPLATGQVETHRVIRILRGRGTNHPVIQTQGDANNAPDPWTAQLSGTTVWRLEAVIPKAGYALSALRGRGFQVFSILVIPALLAVLALRRLWASPPARGAGA